ncbi:UNKNOWN [Stylonychia lemnae]|uniref:Uncharacterized protein n=1 Tax=Stylonychia lemnae TaxID=5949 RepID=A0A077ZZS2_STYLE|nr:UNKNOWN [Stylonychia lemnae]|eukprot:CDW74023.1 UNKNOWN [Stylonychia lemnae]
MPRTTADTKSTNSGRYEKQATISPKNESQNNSSKAKNKGSNNSTNKQYNQQLLFQLNPKQIKPSSHIQKHIVQEETNEEDEPGISAVENDSPIKMYLHESQHERSKTEQELQSSLSPRLQQKQELQTKYSKFSSSELQQILTKKSQSRMTRNQMNQTNNKFRVHYKHQTNNSLNLSKINDLDPKDIESIKLELINDQFAKRSQNNANNGNFAHSQDFSILMRRTQYNRSQLERNSKSYMTSNSEIDKPINNLKSSNDPNKKKESHISRNQPRIINKSLNMNSDIQSPYFDEENKNLSRNNPNNDKKFHTYQLNSNSEYDEPVQRQSRKFQQQNEQPKSDYNPSSDANNAVPKKPKFINGKNYPSVNIKNYQDK